MKSALVTVFTRPVYAAAAVGTGLLVFALTLLLPSGALLKFVFASDVFTPAEKFWTPIQAMSLSLTALPAPTLAVSAATAILFGVNIAMLSFHLKRKIELERSIGTSLAGIVFGVLGVGCASCGSVLLTSFFGTAATLGVLGVLPLKGLEFGLIGIAILLASVLHLSKKIADPETCRISR
jgi:hypothetical protein